MKRMAYALAPVALAVAALFFGGPGIAQQQKTISIGTGGTGGVYYPLGGGMANVLSKYLPGVQATAEVTGGSVDNLKLIGAGRSEIGLSMVDAALEAMEGKDKFKSGKVDVRTLMVLYPNRMHVVSTAGAQCHEDVRPQGQARFHGFARKRHRSDGLPRDRSGRPRSRQGHDARAALGRRIRQTRSRTERSTHSSGSAACRQRRSPTSARRRM